MIKRAYALLDVKSVTDGEARQFDGIATTPTPDRMGDVIDPLGAVFKNPLPLLHQHDAERPIGLVRFKKATAEGIAFSATIPKIAEPGPLKDRVDTAWGEIKAGLIRAVSIGFRILENGVEATAKGLRFTAIEIVELSAVTVPANASATITNIRSFDHELAAPGDRLEVERATLPASRGTPETRDKGARQMPRTISERIAEFTAERVEKCDKLNSIMDAADVRKEPLSPAEAETYDAVKRDLETIDGHLSRLRDQETLNARSAVPVSIVRHAPGLVLTDAQTLQTPPAAAPAYRASPIVRAAPEEPGVRFARIAKSVVLGKMSGRDPVSVAQERYDAEIVEYTKAAVGAATTMNPANMGDLVAHGGPIGEFLEWLRPRTILGRFGTDGIPSLTSVNFRQDIGIQTSGGAGYWVGEAQAKPLTSFTVAKMMLEPLKVATISVLSKELIRDSSPKADVLVRNALVAALREVIDKTFIDPAIAAVAGISPASITNGVVPIPSSGNTAEDAHADALAAYAAYMQGNNALEGAVWIMRSTNALGLSGMRNLVGGQEFGGVSVTGGTFEGFPVIVSDYVPIGNAVLVNAPHIFLGDEGGFTVDMSTEASLEMSDAPVSDSNTPSATGAPFISLWQTNSVGILAERTLSWMRARPEAVVLLSGVNWGAPAGGATLSGGAGPDAVRGGSGRDRVAA